MGWWQVSADTLAGSRFVISPLAEATAMINIAYQKSNDKDMLNELDSIKRMQADAKKLAEQTGGAEAAGAK